MQSRSIAALTHGRYHLVPAEAEGAPLLVGCHGYGETALDHLDALRRIPGSGRWNLCSVQALHPFYRKDGTVVWSWMTKEDRRLAIADNVRYVTSVIEAARDQLGASDVLALAGFSQGAAMAWRAAVRCGLPVAGLVVLAGDVPADVLQPAPAMLPNLLLGRGRSDAWYDAAKMAADLDALAPHGATVETCVFDGGHEWHGEFLAAAGAFLDRLAS